MYLECNEVYIIKAYTPLALRALVSFNYLTFDNEKEKEKEKERERER